MLRMLGGDKGTKTRFIIGGILALVIVFGVGAFFGSSGYVPLGKASAVSELPPEGVDFGSLYKSWRILEENFVPGTTTDALGDQEKVWGAIQGLAASYGDDYTIFLPPEEKEIFESEVRGDFQGVGMEIGLRDEALTVVAPLKGTPAYRAGIESGDTILEIDGEPTRGITTEAAVKKIRGPAGTAVKFLLAREGEEPFEVSVVRDTIILPTIDTEARGDGIFVIRLYGFNAQAPQLFRNAVREFANSGNDKLILDLRGNPGGFLEVAVDIASWFLPVGRTIVTEDYNNESQNNVHRSRGYDVFTDALKFAILIDGGSASASEILAGALREHGKATLIGEKTFGKGSVQQVFPVTADTSLKVTVARWLTPEGRSISHDGIEPDIQVSMTPEDREAGKDPQLDRAVEFLLTGK